jgi:nucleotide-binding universal stress UspA family protein
MYKHVLIPTDGSELSIGAVRQGANFAKAIGAKITLLTVMPPYNAYELGEMWPLTDSEQYRQHAEQQAEKRLATARELVDAAGVPCETVHIEHERPYEAIIETASSHGCDLILMGSHGRRGLSAILLGSETTKVLTHSTIPVLVVR